MKIAFGVPVHCYHDNQHCPARSAGNYEAENEAEISRLLKRKTVKSVEFASVHWYR